MSDALKSNTVDYSYTAKHPATGSYKLRFTGSQPNTHLTTWSRLLKPAVDLSFKLLESTIERKLQAGHKHLDADSIETVIDDALEQVIPVLGKLTRGERIKREKSFWEGDGWPSELPVPTDAVESVAARA